MRYSITINQLALLELKSKITLEEAVLLDYLYWLCTSPSDIVEQMRIEKEGKKYTWFDYGSYLKENPILRGKTKATITPKIRKLENEKFIETIIQNAKNGGDRKYIRLLPKCDGLFRKLNEVVSETKQVSFRKLNVDNNNINNNYINNKEKKIVIVKKEKYPLSAITEQDISEIANQYHTSIGYVKLQLEKLRNYAPNKKGKPYSDYKAALRNFVLLSMERAIEKKQEYKYAPIDARNVK